LLTAANTRVGAVNKAGFVAAFETDGVVIDITSPVVSIR
jgi:CheY-specific phosphatase CheX